MFHGMASEVTSDTSAYNINKLFTYTTYMDDIISVTAAAMNQVLVKKGENLILPLANLTLDASDRSSMADELLLVDVQGITGPISFKGDGHRRSQAFDIHNFLTRWSSNATDNCGEFVISAVMVCNLNDSTFIFYDQNGTVSNESTIVFADNSTSVPPGKPIKWTRSSEFNQS